MKINIMYFPASAPAPDHAAGTVGIPCWEEQFGGSLTCLLRLKLMVLLHADDRNAAGHFYMLMIVTVIAVATTVPTITITKTIHEKSKSFHDPFFGRPHLPVARPLLPLPHCDYCGGTS